MMGNVGHAEAGEDTLRLTSLRDILLTAIATELMSLASIVPPIIRMQVPGRECGRDSAHDPCKHGKLGTKRDDGGQAAAIGQISPSLITYLRPGESGMGQTNIPKAIVARASDTDECGPRVE